MNIDIYREFILLTQLGSFSKAARELQFTQSALSQHIQLLEHQLGVTLLDRNTRKVTLSPAGEIFYKHAQAISAFENDAKAAVRKQLGQKKADLRIGLYPAAGRYSLIDNIQLFQKSYPDISIAYRELLPPALMDAMNAGEFDFIIREEDGSETNDRYDRLQLNNDTLVAVVPSGHPLAVYNEALLTQFAREPFLLLPEHTFVHELAIKACRSQGFSPNVAFTEYNMKNIIDEVANGNGIALLMKTPAQHINNPDTSIIELNPAITSSINLLYRENNLSDCGKQFLKFLPANFLVEC